jgi:hypothetical protein
MARSLSTSPMRMRSLSICNDQMLSSAHRLTRGERNSKPQGPSCTSELLDHARKPTKDNRILVSHDRRTLPRHFTAFVHNNTSSGVFIIGQNVSVRAAINELLLIWSCSESEEWTNLLVDIPL